MYTFQSCLNLVNNNFLQISTGVNITKQYCGEFPQYRYNFDTTF